ncbi:hypothetical protein [Aeromicrobium sp. 179-A 4D2 NHS]|uniref:hypothetical protein n=1 Tax=Aeromicrobium sp. 179-A 4D2 NHS TaxID=3142375 RepID=UPI0039A1F48C
MSITVEPAPTVTETDIFGNPLGRGGYARDGRGSALVVTTDPFDVYKSGAKKGMLKTYAYKAASSIGISTSTEGLDQWKQNRLLLATIIDPDLTTRLFHAMDGINPESDEGKAVFRTFRDEAHELAETQIAATRGSFAHWLTECADNGESPLEGLAHGEAIGIDPGTAERIIAGWEAVNIEFGFKALAVEAKIVNDEAKAAGTTDRVVELTKPLTVTIGGESVVLPVGTIVIVDFKSGKLRRAQRTGLPQYWHKYAAQIATYAGGHPYDPKNHVRMAWTDIGVPARPSQEVGFIVHADLEALADGTSGADPREAFSVFALDLGVGREYAAASNLLRATESGAGKSFSLVEVG